MTKNLHYSILKLYLDLGWNSEKAHRIVKVDESEWLKTFIDKNIESRKEKKIMMTEQENIFSNCWTMFCTLKHWKN